MFAFTWYEIGCDSADMRYIVLSSLNGRKNYINISDIVRWMSIVENATLSTVMSNRLLAFPLLVEIFLKYVVTLKTPS